MTDAPTERDYPLTVVADDAEGNEVYRTQLDWAGSPRNLDDLDNVPSADLNDREPTWTSLRVLNASGQTVHERSNEAARRDDRQDGQARNSARDSENSENSAKAGGDKNADKAGDKANKDATEKPAPKDAAKDAAKDADKSKPASK